MLEASGVSVRYDVIKKRLHISRGGAELGQSDLIGLANLNGLYAQWFSEFVTEIAQENPVNPVADWIRSQPWDKEDRLRVFIATVEADPQFPTGLKVLLIDRWLKSAVAAALRDDFRTRGVLTLQGPQGCGKTSWIARLVPPGLRQEFVKLDHHMDAHNKDSVFIAVSHWITEIGELDSSFKRDVSRLKGFLTNDCDKLRLPYAWSPIELRRKTVFAASVNEMNFLVDATGNSRFWTIPVVKLDYEHTIDMQQLFAQLALEVDAGAPWWLTPEEEALLEEHNARFKAVSVIEERLLEQLEQEPGKPQNMTAIEVLRAIGIMNPGNQQCRECGTFLRARYGPPKRVNGRDRWKVPLKAPEGAWQKYNPDQDEY
jgi:putative DNA primase/helicase